METSPPSFSWWNFFSAHFITSTRERKISIHHAKIQQAKGEDLREYEMRFNNDAVLITDL